MSTRVPFRVSSELLWSPTDFEVVAGMRYRIEVTPPEQTWKDWTLTYDANGGTSFLQRFFRPCLRVKSEGGRRAEFFTLIGTIGKSLEHAFIIGIGPREWTAPISGTLFCFANDCSFAYGNNEGSIDVTITPVA